MNAPDGTAVPTECEPDHGVKSNAWQQGYSDAKSDAWQQQWFEIEGELGDDYLLGWHAGKKVLPAADTRDPKVD